MSKKQTVLQALLWEFYPKNICRISDAIGPGDCPTMLVRVSKSLNLYEVMDDMRTEYNLTKDDVWEHLSGIDQKSGLQLFMIYWKETE
jgi:hypothetical protein